ncbi:hypothetical protein BDV40DRAFT_306977 [Aspergillus tamarii]|uniref:Uncharacterized protein n=1 Tax=Aspergillus tamarii TaxID=41984 RepID=A0A5N6UA62_ASPTM|nr:hypothetical protein BDV40DRAFT_306977 [Aspergillus tamarii]
MELPASSPSGQSPMPNSVISPGDGHVDGQESSLVPCATPDTVEKDERPEATPPPVNHFAMDLLEMLIGSRSHHAPVLHSSSKKWKTPTKSLSRPARQRQGYLSRQVVPKAIPKKRLLRFIGQRTLSFVQRQIQILSQNLRQEMEPSEVARAISIFHRVVQNHPKYAQATRALNILGWCISVGSKARLGQSSTDLQEMVPGEVRLGLE